MRAESTARVSEYLITRICFVTSTLRRFAASAKNSSETETTCAPSATLESSAYGLIRLINAMNLETNLLTQ